MKLLLDTPVDETFFLVLDLETTGLSPQDERVCEIAMIGYKDFKQIYSFATLINPGKHIPAKITEINRIDDNMVKDKPYFYEIIPNIIEVFQNAVLVGHNIQFDINFLTAEFDRAGFIFPKILFIDTLYMARNLGNFSDNKLGNVAKNLDISNQNWHRALSDVEMTYKIFEHFMVILKKEGVYTLKELFKKLR